MTYDSRLGPASWSRRGSPTPRRDHTRRFSAFGRQFVDHRRHPASERTSADMTAHLPRRPTWLCRTCSVEWPCQIARSLLPLDHDNNQIALYRFLGTQFSDAAIDLYQLHPNPGPDPRELYERFLGWVLTGESGRRASSSSPSAGPVVPSLRPHLPANNGPKIRHPDHEPPNGRRRTGQPAADNPAQAYRAYAGRPRPFGALMSELRLRRGWSQQRMAEDLCAVSGLPTVTRHEVSRWERQQRIPGPFWLGHLAIVLKCPAGQLATAATAARRTNSRW